VGSFQEDRRFSGMSKHKAKVLSGKIQHKVPPAYSRAYDSARSLTARRDDDAKRSAVFQQAPLLLKEAQQIPPSPPFLCVSRFWGFFRSKKW
jgi:hypothetical protein